MGYSNGFAMAVRVGGRFVEELSNGELHVPFGETYALRFKNKHDRFAKVDVRIDGEHVGAWEIPPRGSIDIERPTTRDAAFRFASLDSQAAIEAGKSGDNSTRIKGLIDATFYPEIVRPAVTIAPFIYIPQPWYPIPQWPLKRPWQHPYGTICDTNRGIQTQDCANTMDFTETQVACSSLDASTAVSDGCTVGGGTTGQQFGVSYRSFESVGTTLKIFLRGYSPGAVVVAPLPNALPTGHGVQAENARLRAEIARKKQQLMNANFQAENARLRKELDALS